MTVSQTHFYSFKTNLSKRYTSMGAGEGDISDMVAHI